MSIDLTEGQNFVLGTVAAFLEAVLLQPTLYWKNAANQGLPFTLKPEVVYRGAAASIFNEMQMMGLQMMMTGIMKKIVMGDDPHSKLTKSQEIYSAAIGGTVTSIFTCPVELVMIQQQVHGRSIFETPRMLVKQHGWMAGGLFRGLGATAGREFVYVGAMLGVTPTIQRTLVEKYDVSMGMAGLYASTIGGVVASIPSHPFDVIKTCMQGDAEQMRYKGFRHTVRALWREGGARRFLHGAGWRTANIIATVYVANECRVRLEPWISTMPLPF